MADEFSDAFSDSGSGSQNDFLKLQGFVSFEQGGRISGTGPAYQNNQDQDYVLAIRRLRLKADKSFKKGAVYFKVDFNHNNITKDFAFDVREARFVYRLDSMDISVGRQVSTWGVGDFVFINDLFPKNWYAHFTGREMDMIKDPADSIRLTNYLGAWTSDFVVAPHFSPDRVPQGCYFETMDPNSGSLILDSQYCENSPYELRSEGGFKEAELALSLTRKVGKFDLTFYGYRGFYKNPKGVMFDSVSSSLKMYYPRLEVYGLSLEGQLGPGIFSFESGYYNSKEDQEGDDFFVENSDLKYLVGYRMDLTSRLSFGAQLFQEYMMNYEDYEASYLVVNPSRYNYRLKELRNTLTLRLSYKALQDTLFFNFFAYYRPENKDSFLKLEVVRRFSDHFEGAVGANLFDGNENYMDRNFGMLRDADNAFIRLKYIF